MKLFYFLILSLIPFFVGAQTYNIFVSDAGNYNKPPWQIIKYDSDGNNSSTFIANNLDWPQDILFLENTGTVLVSNLNSGRIVIHDDETGDFIDDFATGIAGPTRIKIGPDGNVYVLQWGGNGKVKRYSTDGTPLGNFTSMGVPQSIGLDWDENGNLYVSSYSADYVRKFDVNGVDQGLFVDSNLAGPTNIWFDENGELLVSDYDGTSVKRFDESGQFLGSFISGLSHSEGVAYLPNGEILIGNGSTSSIKRFSSEGNYIDDLVPSGAGNLLTPNAVVLHSDKSLSDGAEIDLNKRMIHPILGKQFNIDSLFAPNIAKVEVYNLSGFFVDTFNDLTWNAERFANGAYISNIIFKDGNILSERIVVNH